MLNRFCWIFVSLFALIQVLLVTGHHAVQYSDANTYLMLAQKSIQAGGWYPGVENIYSDYIFAPGYVNYLVFLLKYLNASITEVLYFNVILNLLLLALCWRLAKDLFGDRVAKIAVILFCLYLTNYGVILFTLSDILFAVLAYSGLSLSSRQKYWMLILAGVCLGFANWVRPVAFVFVIACCALIFLRRKRLVDLIPLFAGLIMTIAFIGVSTQNRMGYFNFSSTTSGLLLLMGANDDMTGTYAPSVFDKGKAGYLPNKSELTFVERDKFYKEKAIEWIKEHPVKYLSYLPVKVVKLFSLDYFYIGELSGIYDHKSIGDASFWQKISFYVSNLVNQIIYVILIFCAASTLFVPRLRVSPFVLVVAGIVFLGGAATVIAIVAPRYHYPYMPAVIILAAVFLDDWLTRSSLGIRCAQLLNSMASR